MPSPNLHAEDCEKRGAALLILAMPTCTLALPVFLREFDRCFLRTPIALREGFSNVFLRCDPVGFDRVMPTFPRTRFLLVFI